MTSVIQSLGVIALSGSAAIAQTCPSGEPQWQAWRDNAITIAFDLVRDVQAQTFIDYGSFISLSASIRQVGEDCFGLDNNVVDVPANLRPTIGNFFDFFGSIGLEADDAHQFGMTVDDLTYLNEIRSVIALPPLLTSQEFLAAVSDRTRYSEALNIIQRNNALLAPADRWIPLIYKSRFLTTPDAAGTYGRFFVLVPGPEIDKWIQFGILTPDMAEAQINNLSIAAVRRLPGHTSELPRTEAFLVDYWRTYGTSTDRNGAHQTIEVRTKLESGMGSENCSECHKTPILGIHPDVVYRFNLSGELEVVTGAAAEAVPDVINGFIEDYGAPNYRGWQPQVRYGPAMGPVARARPDSFFDACTAGTNVQQSSYEDLREAMNCTACHNETLIGRINFPQAARTTREFALAHPDTGAFSPLVQTYVLEGWMPPGIPLDPNERVALVQCLHDEYLDLEADTGLLIDWLKGGE